VFETLKEKIGKMVVFLMKDATPSRITTPPWNMVEKMKNEAEWCNLKMYILICDDTPINIVPLIATHTAMGTYKTFRCFELTYRWFQSKLQKTVICKVTREQFEKAKEHGKYFALTEVHHQEFGELGLGFSVQKEYPKFFKFLKLYTTQ
jgi:hypothetical protein